MIGSDPYEGRRMLRICSEASDRHLTVSSVELLGLKISQIRDVIKLVICFTGIINSLIPRIESHFLRENTRGKQQRERMIKIAAGLSF